MYIICTEVTTTRSKSQIMNETEVTTTRSKSQIMNEHARLRRPNRPCVIKNQNEWKIHWESIV